jgi:tRNA-dihydrouridine synthase A
MMDRTDRCFRRLLRLLTRETLLYSEMVTTGAILFGDRDRFLAFDPEEKPLALQLGGGDPDALARCARIGEEKGYDEINLNIGCPSSRVQRGDIGVCLMREPEKVAAAVIAMQAACSLPVTVKHRIGVDELDRYEDLKNFVDTVSAAGADRCIVHARKAWLKGLSPKENRTIPPLRYDDVHRLKADFPDRVIEINGGIRTLEEALPHLERVDGVMIGRAAWDDPCAFARADTMFFGKRQDLLTREQVALALRDRFLDDRPALKKVVRALVHLFTGCPGAKAWKRTLSERGYRDGAGYEVVEQALAAVPEASRTAQISSGTGTVGDLPHA